MGGGPAGDAWGSPRRPGKGPERAAGARGPRTALAFRVSLSTKLGCGRWRAPPSGLPVRRRRRPRGLQRGDRAPYLGYWGQPRVPFLKPGDVCTKNMPRAAVCCPLRGNHLRIGTRVLILLCHHGCVPPHRAGAAFPKGAWPAKKGCPLRDLGAFPRLILSLPVARTRLLSSIPRGRAKPEAFSKARGQPGGRIARTSQSSLRTALNSKHIQFIERCREKRCFRDL